MVKEFKQFAMRGNVVDLAIGVIIGAAFGRIVDSLVNDIIMPFIGAIGGADFSNWFFGLSSKVVASNLVDAKSRVRSSPTAISSPSRSIFSSSPSFSSSSSRRSTC